MANAEDLNYNDINSKNFPINKEVLQASSIAFDLSNPGKEIFPQEPLTKEQEIYLMGQHLGWFATILNILNGGQLVEENQYLLNEDSDYGMEPLWRSGSPYSVTESESNHDSDWKLEKEKPKRTCKKFKYKQYSNYGMDPLWRSGSSYSVTESESNDDSDWELKKQKPKSVGKKFKCKQCGRKFASNHGLAIHKSWHKKYQRRLPVKAN